MPQELAAIDAGLDKIKGTERLIGDILRNRGTAISFTVSVQISGT
jgi:hypothetical protein